MFIDEFEFDINDNIFPECEQRRHKLVELITKQFPNKIGIVCLWGNFDSYEMQGRFVQDASFFYLTGIQEAGCMIIIDLATKKTTLYIPHYSNTKRQWDLPNIAHDAQPDQFCVDKIQPLGCQKAGIMLAPWDSDDHFANFFDVIIKSMSEGKTIFTITPNQHMSYGMQLFFDHMKESCRIDSSLHLISINDVLIKMRMKKSEQEIARIYRAIDITITAYEAATSSIQDEIAECEIQATMEFVYTAHGCVPAFPTIVASGNNATILHYNKNSELLKQGDLVLIDTGVRCDQYCADLSRTYPISGKFTARQKALYEIVLEVQAQLAETIQPGYFINNKEQADRSLQHIAISLFKKYDLAHYFIHSIGHHLGLNVHDVANYAQPLEEGNVITIEPGLYIPEEQIGIRIEDNYWITKKGAVCLSENLPKTSTDIEKMMKTKF